MSKEKYALFIGRWQSPFLHNGHLWLLQQAWDKGQKVLIAIRDVETDEKNPYTATQILENITAQLSTQISEGRCKVIIIPDIETVYYGRSVGYDVVELVPPEEIGKVSASEIRKGLNLSQNEQG